MKPADRLYVRCLVYGLVQGVNFRAETVEVAQDLGISGLVRNLPDGRVEVLASAASGNLQRFISWLHNGPPHADVSLVEVADTSASERAEIDNIGAGVFKLRY